MTIDTTNDPCFRFQKVDTFFSENASIDQWQRVVDVSSPSFDAATRTLSLTARTSEPDSQSSALLVQVPRHDILRIRYNPDHATAAEYPAGSPRSRANAVAAALAATAADRARAADLRSPTGTTAEGSADPERVVMTAHSNRVELTTYHEGLAHLRVCVTYQPFNMRVWRVSDTGTDNPVVSDAEPALLFRRNRCQGQAYGASIMAIKGKPGGAMYTGFGEHGAGQLFNDRIQHTFFNYDNYGYRKVYGKGAGDEHEPLYHSSTFFLEFNGTPGQTTACGFFVDNTSQTLVDLGVTDEDQVRFVSMFGELDYTMFVGDTPADVINGYGLLIDHARLKPRWALGYHQGCYGYTNRSILEETAKKYRDYQIPIDGLHIDVDIQQEFRTFTIDENNFPCPKQMFSDLRDKGYKCSTNITPLLKFDDAYAVYTEAKASGFLVADRRSAPAGRDHEVYQDYNGGAPVDGLNESKLDPSNYDTGGPYIGGVDYGNGQQALGCYPDLGRAEVRAWWGKQYQWLFEQGLEMVWQDMTTPAIRHERGDMCGFPFKLMVSDDSEGIHEGSGDSTPVMSPAIAAWNLYSYNLHKATYQGLNALSCREDKRNFIIGRGGYSGMSRYAALWTGDNLSTWDFLRMSIPQMLAIGLSAQPICGPDVGGFGLDSGQWADPALLIRWTAAGAFFPWFRNHYNRHAGKLFQEPWAYDELDLQHWGIGGQAWLYKSVLPICKYYIELRYRMMQLFYDGMFNNMLTGMPICRPLFLVHPKDTSLLYERCSFQSNEFMVGDDLLVAPVLDPDDTCNGHRDVYLPAGSDWYCFANDQMPLCPPVAGGDVLSFNARISSDPGHIPFIVPLYVRAGAVIPMTEVEQYVGERNANGQALPITYTIFPGPEGHHTSYLDDGISRSSAPEPDDAFDEDQAGKAKYREVTVNHRFESQQRFIDITRGHDGYQPLETFFYVALRHDPSECPSDRDAIDHVELDGAPVEKIICGTTQERDAALRASTGNAWYYNDVIRTSYLKVFDPASATRFALVAAYSAD